MTDPIAVTKQGQLRGIEKLGCLQFRGVPFAAPPVGDLRWRSPRPPSSWDGLRDATQFGAICPQVAGTLEALGAGRVREENPMDEDCLTLNLFTPSVDDARRPVMVWIHGGAFSTGSGRLPWYFGHNFARDGVVVVTINYRVSAFGFLHLEDAFGNEFRDSSSVGTQDQIAALEWVQDNIERFGGDPDNVTIFGESAGGMSVGTLLAAPKAKGLFHKAIPQSGASHSSLPPEVASLVTARFCELAGVRPGDTEALRALTVDQIVVVLKSIGELIAAENVDLFGDGHSGFTMAFQPVFGGDVLPKFPIEALRDGSGAGVPTLVGTTKEEWKLFTLMVKRDARLVREPRPLRNLCAKADRSATELVDVYERRLGEPSAVELRELLETDHLFRIPAIRLAEAQVANDTPTWMYRFDFRSPAFGGRLGACHALEIPFVFDNLDAPGVNMLTGNDAPQSLATAAHAAWVAFAKTGDPTTDTLAWPAFDTDRRATALLDAEVRVVDDPDRELREVWAGLY